MEVIHWTTLVATPNSFIKVGKATFIAVSTKTPLKDMRPVAVMAA